MKRLVLGTLALALAPAAFATWTEQFTITQAYTTQENSMHFRVFGHASRPECPPGPGWGYVSPTDSGGKAKITTLLAAYAAGKQVSLNLQPTDFYGDGRMFCHVEEIKVVN